MSYLYTHWNSCLILPNIAILISYFHCKHGNSGPILPNIGILVLFKRDSCHLFLANTWILAQFLYTLVVLSYPSKHWDTGPISTSIGIMILSWNRWTSGSIFILIGILILPLQIILLFYPYFYRHRNSDLILPNIGIQNWIIVILAFFFQTLEFLSHSFTANIEILAPSFEKCEFWFFFFLKIAIPILSFQTLEFWAYVL